MLLFLVVWGISSSFTGSSLSQYNRGIKKRCLDAAELNQSKYLKQKCLEL